MCNQLKDVSLTSNIRAALQRIQPIPSLSKLPTTWQKQLTLKELKQVAMRANAPSSWQSFGTKSKMINCLQEKVKEHTDFVRSIRAFSFEEYVAAGKDEVQTVQHRKSRKRRKDFTGKPSESYNSLALGVEVAMAAAVHIIPSGSGIHLGSGFVLTCAHCVVHDDYIDTDEHDDEENSKIERTVELVNARGEIFGSICVHACNKSDLALLKIFDEDLECISLGSLQLAKLGCDPDGTDIFALGNPCDTDLENPGGKSNNGFHPFHVSRGKLERKINLARASKLGLGQQIHSAWTYWGHSGSPLVSVQETTHEEGVVVQIVGIHNSWDDSNGNRHGIPLRDIWNFISLHSDVSSE